MSMLPKKKVFQKKTAVRNKSHSYTSPEKRARIRAKYAAGKTKQAIKTEEHVSWKTVHKFCTDEEAMEAVAQIKRDYVNVGVDALRTVDYHIKNKKDLNASFKVLRNLGVHSEPGEGAQQQPSAQVNLMMNQGQANVSEGSAKWLVETLRHMNGLGDDFSMDMPKPPGDNGNKLEEDK